MRTNGAMRKGTQMARKGGKGPRRFGGGSKAPPRRPAIRAKVTVVRPVRRSPLGAAGPMPPIGRPMGTAFPIGPAASRPMRPLGAPMGPPVNPYAISGPPPMAAPMAPRPPVGPPGMGVPSGPMQRIPMRGPPMGLPMGGVPRGPTAPGIARPPFRRGPFGR